MPALDTNIIVRYIIRHREPTAQARVAETLMDSLDEDNPGYLSREVLIEIASVLERSYKVNREGVFHYMTELITNRDLEVEAPDDIYAALRIYRTGTAGFGDCMILVAARRARRLPVLTFDRRFARERDVQLLE